MAAILSPSAKQQFFTDAGLPAAGYKLHTYAANTTTPQATYANRAGTVPNANPIILNSRGEATIYLTPGLVYDYQFVSPDGAQVWTQEDVIADAGDANSVVFTQSGTGAVQRSVLDKLRETVSIKDYGALGNGVADDLPAFTAAINYLQSIGGGRLYLPAGNYKVSASINLSSADYLWIDGAGQDNTTVITSSATADVFYSNSDRKYRKFSNFTVSSSVTKTAGACFNLLMERRSVFADLKVTKWFDGVILRGFEETELQRVKIVNPTGAGTALVAGTAGSAGSGANLHVTGCFIRGNDDIAQTAPVANWGIQAYDIDALYMIDVDVGAFLLGDMRIAPTSRAANFHFTTCFFDATKGTHCVTVEGAGSKSQWGITNCWFSSAGKLTGGSAESCGLFLADQGGYSGIQFTGCRFYNNSASGAYQGKAGSVQFTGCSFEANGTAAAGDRYGFKFNPSVAVGPGALLCGCFFSGNAPKAIQTTANARELVLEGCILDNGMDYVEGTILRAKSADKVTNSVPSATRLAPSPCHDFIRVTGTTNIAGINVTYVGHRLTMKFDNILTVIDGSQNLSLAGNLATAAGSILTLCCDGATWWEVGRVTT